MKEKTKNTSASKKLIPAVAMLTTSAIMLSSATYAWFTMNKEVEVKGLEMAATAGGGLEISLGNIGDSNALNTINTPAMDNISWKRSVNVGEYYDQIGKIKPASSIDANNLFYASDNDITAGGKVVQDSATVTQTLDGDEVGLNVLGTYNASGQLNVKEKPKQKEGYYIDIPMWIRTTSKTPKAVKCEVTITDGTVDNIEKSVEGNELQKAVRVAVIPLAQENVTSTGTTTGTLDIAKAATYTTGSAINVFGTTFDSYNGTIDTPKAIKSAKLADAAYSGVLSDVTFSKIKIDNGADVHTDTANVFTLPAAADNSYSVQSFVVRVWLEGESIYCNDANAQQDWNVQLNFKDATDAGA